MTRILKWTIRILPAGLLTISGMLHAQSCQTADDMDAATRTALVNAAQRDYTFLSHGDSAGLKQASSPSLAADFAGIEAVVQQNHAELSQAQAGPRPPFLLKADKPDAQNGASGGEFLCGVFGAHGQTANSAEFVLPNLPAGQYGIVILDAASKIPVAATFVLLQLNGDWKLAGLSVKNSQTAGHNADWYAQKARDFAAKGQRRNAWLYFLEARDLVVPVQYMSTQSSDKIYGESQPLKPADLPDASPVELASGTAKYQLTAIFPDAVGNDLDLIVKYQNADVSNTGKTYEENQAVAKALLMKYPEFRDAFAGVVVRAVEPSGRDYGSLMAMKDIK